MESNDIWLLIIGALIATAISIPATIWLNRKNLNEEYNSGKYIGTGLLAARELSVSRLVSVTSDTENVEDKLQILWDGEPLNTPNIYSVVIEIANKGKNPIRSDDYESDIEIAIDAEKVLTVSQTEGSDLPLKINFNGKNKIIIEKLLLNSEDGFKLTILANNYKAFDIKVRIAGAKVEILPDAFIQATKSKWTTIEYLIFLIIFILVISSFLPASIPSIFLFISLLIGALILVRSI